VIKSSNKIHFFISIEKTARKVFFYLSASPYIPQTLASPKTAECWWYFISFSARR